MSTPGDSETRDRVALPAQGRLLEIVRELTEEKHPRRKGQFDVRLDKRLREDLGLDQLARAELLRRLQASFRLSLPSSLAAAPAVRDLLQAIESAAPGLAASSWSSSETSPPRSGDWSGPPFNARTLVDVLSWHAHAHADRLHIRFLANDDKIETLTYAQLRQRAEEVATGLRMRGLTPGDTVAMMLPTTLDFFYAFFGILIAGGVPIPIYPPSRPSGIEDHLRRQVGILENARSVLLVSIPEMRVGTRFLRAQVTSLQDVVTVDDLRTTPDLHQLWPAPAPDDLAFLQYTSGSTGRPKGVMLTHANLLANVRALGQAFQLDGGRDVFVSWLPLYHDMGLIAAWMASMYFGIPIVLMSPQRFLARPVRWLQAISQYGGTLSAAPNFAYELCLSRIRDEETVGIDLSSWRIAANGAESVLPATLRGFYHRFAKYGFKNTTLSPAYGLAENCVGVTFFGPHRELVFDRVKRASFMNGGVAESASEDDETAMEFPSCGQPLPGHDLRILDGTGRLCPDRQEGSIEFRGPSSTKGYYRNADATRALRHGDWLRSGDLGYIANGELFVTGRAKDVVKRAGRNIFAPEIESAASEVPGVRKGCVAVFGARRQTRGTETLVVMAETRVTDKRALSDLRDAVARKVIATIGEPPDDVALVRPYTVLKTSSGKIRRAANRAIYERGEHHGSRAALLQLTRIGLGAVLPEAKVMLRNAGARLYAVWWWLMAGLGAALTLPVLVISRRAGERWIRVVARLFLRVVGARTQVIGVKNIPASGPVMIASNHTSGIDVLLFAALLPRNVILVASEPLRASTWQRPFLRALGVRIAVPGDHGVAAELRRELDGGRAMVALVETGVDRWPGLRPFRLEPFALAVDAKTPVVPLAVRGARTMLRFGSRFPRRADVSVQIGVAKQPEGQGWEAVLSLRNRVRAEMLRMVGEPDLYYDNGALAGDRF